MFFGICCGPQRLTYRCGRSPPLSSVCVLAPHLRRLGYEKNAKGSFAKGSFIFVRIFDLRSGAPFEYRKGGA